MAATEAGAAWQRSVQEDAKKAPKFTCCSLTTLQSGDAPGFDVLHGKDHDAATICPLNWNSSDPRFLPDTRWWLQSRPDFACRKNLKHEKLVALDTNKESADSGDVFPTSKSIRDSSQVETCKFDINQNPCSFLVSQQRVSFLHMERHMEARSEELKAISGNLQPSFKQTACKDEIWGPYEQYMDWNSVDQLTFNEKACYNFEMHCIEGDKTEKWWRTADKDELAKLVAKSLELIENCDLPPPQSIKVKRGLYASVEASDQNLNCSSLDRNKRMNLLNEVEFRQKTPPTHMVEKHWSSNEGCHTCSGPEIPHIVSDGYSDVIKYSTESGCAPESNPCEALLLDALCHSQKRAREAEKASKQAHAETEHVIKLLLRQASHLFACRQWLQIFQLESFLLQLKMKDNQKMSSFLPGLPLMNSRQFRKGVYKVVKRNVKYENNGFCKYAVAVVIGLGFVGAGLLLGWTMGWLFPF